MAEPTKNTPNQNIDKTKTGEKTGQGAQAGGKNPPTGGPDLYKPNQPMEGEKKSGSQQNQGGQGGQNFQKGGQARDPYPPTNPERPVMGGSQGGNVQGQKGGQNVGQGGQNVGQGSQFKGGSTGGNVGGSTPGTIPAAGGIAGTSGKPGATGGLEEEE